LTEELGLPVAEYGSLTIKRRKKLRGLKPDECFWIQNETLVRNLKTYKLRRDPPPDLIVDVDLTRSAVNRMEIYATLKASEVWRFCKSRLEFQVLQEDGKYAVQSTSRAFPGIPSEEINRFLAMRGETEQNSLIREFRDWVRSRS
jgi:Uma2 family endonuclease